MFFYISYHLDSIQAGWRSHRSAPRLGKDPRSFPRCSGQMLAQQLSDADARVFARRAERLAELKLVLDRMGDEIASAEAECTAAGIQHEAASEETPNRVTVMIGTSAMASADPQLIPSITNMINTSYYNSLRELLPEHQTEYERVDENEVSNRLEMGDAGARANRVLHLAYRNGLLVGCCSSTYQPPWTSDGCGHWGLLVVAREAQGTGVAAAIIAAAERRLAGACTHVQIEYDYTPGHAESEKLAYLYETKFGFVRSRSHPRRRGDNEFRKCHKKLPAELVLAARPAYLRGMRSHLAIQLASYAAAQPGGVDRVGSMCTLVGLSSEAFNGRVVSVVWYDDDENEYIVRCGPAESSAGAGCEGHAEENNAEQMDEVMLRVSPERLLTHSPSEMDSLEAPATSGHAERTDETKASAADDVAASTAIDNVAPEPVSTHNLPEVS